MDVINTDSFKLHVEELLRQWHVPGLSIAAFDQEKSVAAGFGFMKLDPPVPATPDTIYDMASTSKSLTAASIGKLIADEEKGRGMQWDTPMSKLLPEDFVLSDTYATEHATIEDILSHRSGLPRHDDSTLGIKAKVSDTPQSVTRNLRNLSLTAPLRTRYQYCNLMYTVATYLVEKLSGTMFSQFLQENFCDVLGMTSTYLQPSAVINAGQEKRLADRHIWDKEQQIFKALEPSEQPECQGAGSIQSTVKDYALWVQAMMKRDSSLFPEKIYKELVRPRIICEADDDYESLRPHTSHELYALAWSVRSYRGHQIIEHDGLIFGVGSTMLYLPSDNFGIVICANGDEAPAVNDILAMEIIDHVLNVPTEERIDWAEREKTRYEEAEAEQVDIDHMRRETCPDGVQPLRLPLEVFTGTFENAGYHKIVIDVQDGSLHVDGSDRSEPFQMFFEHLCDNKKFIATITEVTGEKLHWRSEFRFSETGTILAVGIAFSDELKSTLIWFDKV